jgi:hypothetical protein
MGSRHIPLLWLASYIITRHMQDGVCVCRAVLQLFDGFNHALTIFFTEPSSRPYIFPMLQQFMPLTINCAISIPEGEEHLTWVEE